jgi:hypothetical protein
MEIVGIEGDTPVGEIFATSGHRATRVGVKHAPADELLGEVSRGLVVDDRERAEVLVPYGKDAAVVVAPLSLDGRDVAGERADLVLG